jgi:hypothetical protein
LHWLCVCQDASLPEWVRWPAVGRHATNLKFRRRHSRCTNGCFEIELGRSFLTSTPVDNPWTVRSLIKSAESSRESTIRRPRVIPRCQCTRVRRGRDATALAHFSETMQKMQQRASRARRLRETETSPYIPQDPAYPRAPRGLSRPSRWIFELHDVGWRSRV